MSDPFILIQALDFAYPGAEKLFINLSLAVNRGDSILLRGPNGSGKSTLLRLLAGLLKPQSGSIIVGEVTKTGKKPAYPAGIVYHGQNPRDNLFGLVPRHDLELWQLAEPGAIRVLTAGDQADPLSAKLDEPYARLSNGELRAGAQLLLPCLMHRFWLLDEPTLGLDSRRSGAFRDLCRAKVASGMGMLIVSHDPELPKSLFNRVLTLKHGQLLEEA